MKYSLRMKHAKYFLHFSLTGAANPILRDVAKTIHADATSLAQTAGGFRSENIVLTENIFQSKSHYYCLSPKIDQSVLFAPKYLEQKTHRMFFYRCMRLGIFQRFG